MADGTRKQLQRATIVFWVLLFYIVAALVWWFFSLENQSSTIHTLRQQRIATTDSALYSQEWTIIEKARHRTSVKYIGEGATFLLLIFFGAVYIYRLVRRQFRVQQQQQNFVMAVTHELKTPLAVTRLNLETLQKHRLDSERQQKLIDITLQETHRLDTLINNILIASQLDDRAYAPAREDVDLSSLVEGLLHQVAARYPDKKIKGEVEEDIHLPGDTLLLRLLVSNLLENANKYAPRQTTIRCGLQVQHSTITLTVSDEGMGIPDGEKKKIFRKFYRVGNEQTRTTKGTGLGLYLCKKIAQSHGGTITVTDNLPQGSTFVVTFTA